VRAASTRASEIHRYSRPSAARWASAALEFGHFGSVNPKGCQKVAGGRRGFWGRRPPGNSAGDVLHPGKGARLVSDPRRAARSVARWSRLWHPAGVLGLATRFAGGRSGEGGNDHRLPSANPPGWPPFRLAKGKNSSGALGQRALPSSSRETWATRPAVGANIHSWDMRPALSRKRSARTDVRGYHLAPGGPPCHAPPGRRSPTRRVAFA
jgi:hypothetical protein